MYPVSMYKVTFWVLDCAKWGNQSGFIKSKHCCLTLTFDKPPLTYLSSNIYCSPLQGSEVQLYLYTLLNIWIWLVAHRFQCQTQTSLIFKHVKVIWDSYLYRIARTSPITAIMSRILITTPSAIPETERVISPDTDMKSGTLISIMVQGRCPWTEPPKHYCP